MSITNAINEMIARLSAAKCWYVSCGGCVGSTFSLSLGQKLLRKVPLLNSAHSEEYRHYEGEFALFVWSTWRLDGLEAPICSSDQPIAHITHCLDALVGQTLIGITIASPVADLTLRFTNSLTLLIFCDHVGSESSFDGNWECVFKERVIVVGSSGVIEIHDNGSNGDTAL